MRLGTYGAGLNRLDRRDGAVRRYRHDPVDPASLRDDVVWAIHRASSGAMWIGTAAGLCTFDPRTERFRPYDLPLPPGETLQVHVAAIAEDPRGRLWLTGGYGLYRLDPSSGTARLYRPAGGAPGSSWRPAEAVLVQDVETIWIGLASRQPSRDGHPRRVPGADRVNV